MLGTTIPGWNHQARIEARQEQFRYGARLRELADVLDRHPDLVHMGSHGGLQLNPVHVNIGERLESETYEEYEHRNTQANATATARALRNAGFTVTKRYDDDENLRLGVEIAGFDIGRWFWGYCQRIPTGELETVTTTELVEVETTREKTRKICKPVLLEDV